MARTAIISVDGHVKASRQGYREYLPARFHEAYDDWVREAEHAGRPDAGSLQPGLDPQVQWDSDARLIELERAGVVAEVLFPNGQPFQLNPADDYPRAASPELLEAGRLAYNRWLVDFCAEAPDRRRGQAQVCFADPDQAVADIEWAKENGLGGIMLPPLTRESRVFYDEALRPIWAALTDTGLPVTVHGGASTPDYGTEGGFAAMATMVAESGFWSTRSLWQLIAGGVFDEFPALRVAYVETHARLLVAVLVHLNSMANPNGDWMGFARTMDREELIARPASEYLGTNVFVGISPLSELQIGYDDLIGRGADGEPMIGVHIGAAAGMCGVDFPHYENVVDRAMDEVAALASVPGAGDQDLVSILFANAATVFGFEREALQAHVDRVGFDLDEVRAGSPRLARSEPQRGAPALGASLALAGQR